MPMPFSAIPGPKGLPLIGTLLNYTKFGRYSFERMHLAKQENYAMYGKIYKEKIGMAVVNLFDPTDFETVYRAEGKYPFRPAVPLLEVASKRDNEPLGFASLNGEPWWRQRSVVQKSMMSPAAAHVYLPAQNQVADDFVKLISRKLEEGSGKLEEDVTKILAKYALEAFAVVCFNVRIGCLDPSTPSESESSNKVLESVDKMFEAMQKTLFSFPWYAMFRTPLYRQFSDSLKTFTRIAHTYVDEALKSDHKVEEVAGKKMKEGGGGASCFLRSLVDKHSEKLTNEEMTKISIELFSAGIDSTAYAVGFCLYNLARNVDKQDRLLSEIDSILDRSSFEPVTPEVLNRMQYLKACVKESFRLNFPIEGGPMKKIASDLVLSDYLVPKGTFVTMNFQTICLQEEYFPHADRYLPERWLKGEGDNLRPASNFVMLPFGHGSRMCIGRRFAEQETWLALIKIIQRFRLKLEDEAGEHQPIGMLNRLFTMPDARIPLQFIPRQ